MPTFDFTIHKYDFPKPNNAVKSFKKYVDLIAKMRSFNDLMINMPGGLVVLSHNTADSDALPTENFLIWKEKEAATFFNWVMIDPKKAYADIKSHNFKAREMRVVICNDKIQIKENEGPTPAEMWPGAKPEDYGIVELDKLHEGEDHRNIAIGTSFYTCMDKYMWNVISGVVPFTPIEQDTANVLASGRNITLRIPQVCDLKLMRSLFPLYKSEGIPLSYAVVDQDEELHKAYILFKEEYTSFDLYTLLACLTISTVLDL